MPPARKAGTVRRKATLTDLDIPKLVKEVGQCLGLTQEQLARKVGVHYGSVNHWKKSKRRRQSFLVRCLLEMKEAQDLAGTLPFKRKLCK